MRSFIGLGFGVTLIGVACKSFGGAPVAQEMWRQALFSHLSSDSWHPTQLIFNSPGPSAVGGRTAAHASRNTYSRVFHPASPGRDAPGRPPGKLFFFAGLGAGVDAGRPRESLGSRGGGRWGHPPGALAKSGVSFSYVPTLSSRAHWGARGCHREGVWGARGVDHASCEK